MDRFSPPPQIQSPFLLVISLDYEISVHGEPDVRSQVTLPTAKLLEICDKHGAKLTIMVELGELLAFEQDGLAAFKYDAAAEIRTQLVKAVQSGHDVQLHLHPQWLNGHWDGRDWRLDYKRYALPNWPEDRIEETLRHGKAYLEDLLKPHCGSYNCVGFRAGNWVTQPCSKYLRALRRAGFLSDTSVFKGGYKDAPPVFFDYRTAWSRILPWIADWDDINTPGHDGHGVLEIPIYAEPSTLLGMLSLKRLRIARRYRKQDRMNRQESVSGNPSPPTAHDDREKSRKSAGMRRHAKKLDFCKLGTSEMVRQVRHVITRYEGQSKLPLPIMMIGHSNELLDGGRDLDAFLTKVRRSFPDQLGFANYRDAVRLYSGQGTSDTLTDGMELQSQSGH